MSEFIQNIYALFQIFLTLDIIKLNLKYIYYYLFY